MNLTQLEFNCSDITFAKRMANQLGFSQTAYTSTSELIGMYCLPDKAGQKHGVIIKTASLGFLFVSTLEDLQLHGLDTEQREQCEREKADKLAKETAAKENLVDEVKKEMVRFPSFNNLVNYAKLKGIVAERYHSKRIELTTPCGGTTAECESLSEAIDTLLFDTAFSGLPVK